MVLDKVYTNIDFSKVHSLDDEFDNCTFLNCNFSGLNMTAKVFYETVFEACDMSNANLNNTSFQDVSFINCKLLGLRFDACKTFLLEFKFTDSSLNYSSFFGLKIPKTIFKNCNLTEVDFSEADLNNTNFEGSNLLGAMFSNTILEVADFRNTANFSIDPELNYIRKAKFSGDSLFGLLYKYNLQIE
jgi:fluoroquinolone resistance protein